MKIIYMVSYIHNVSQCIIYEQLSYIINGNLKMVTYDMYHI